MIKIYDLDMAIEKENEIRNKCEIEKNRIANYCNDIKKKFENVDRTIRNYEETVQHLKEENEKIADEYDIKIDELEQKNNKIVKRIDNRIDLFNHQKAQIIEGENKVNNILQSIEIQKNEFNEKSMINKIKYDELEKKFDWLINSTSGFSYRIDCYFEKYKLAIEYDGVQHYEIDGFFNKNQKDLKIKQKRDNEKDRLCKENNLKLIRFKEKDIKNTKTIEKKLKEYSII